MNLEQRIRVLEAAQGDPAKLALAAVTLAYGHLPESELVAITQSLEAAAVPHWCDERVLMALLDISPEKSAERLAQLSRLTVVEPFPARGQGAINVHEANRSAVRQRLASSDQDRFRTFSRRMADYFASDSMAAGRIEWIYHLLCADPERGALELEKLDRDWSSSAHPEHQYALVAAAAELERSGLVQDRARVWVLLVVTWMKYYRSETVGLEDAAKEIVPLARSASARSGEANALSLVGRILQAQGRSSEALANYLEAAQILHDLAREDPNNADWQRECAVIQSSIAEVFEARGKLAEAQRAYEESRATLQALVQRDERNDGWQRELAAAHNCLGRVLQAQGRLEEAQGAYSSDLTISRKLVEQDPDNASWQRDLGISYATIGAVQEAQGKQAEAQEAYAKSLEISQRLVERDGSNLDWQYGLAIAHNRLGNLFFNQNKLEDAYPSYSQNLEIMRRLTEQDPTKAGWRRELAIAHANVGAVLEFQKRLEEARAAYAQYVAIMLCLVNMDETNTGWQRDLASAYQVLGRTLVALGKSKEAEAAYQEERAINHRLEEQDSTAVGS